MSAPEILFYVIVGILVADYILGRILEYLNAKNISLELPGELKGIYNEEEYKKSQQYEIDNQKMSLVTSTFNLIVILLLLMFDGFAFVDQVARSITSNPILIPLIFFGILMFAFDIINTPFAVYDTFVIEQKYGFNTTTVKTFITDKLKGWLLSAILGGGLLALVVWFYHVTGDMFWIYTWILITLFSVFMTMFYTQWLLPLFNKLSPLEEGELKSSIFSFSRKAGFNLKDIFVMDGSKRSTKANAFFSGLGRKKKIILFDTLIDELKKNEIVSVLAHEIGHYKKKHTMANLGLSVIQTGITLYILSLFIGNPVLSQALSVSQPSFHIGLITFGLLYSPISTVIGIAMNNLSRKFEYKADEFAIAFGLGNDLIEALKRLSVKNLSNLTPHPVYVFVNYSHPPLLERLRYLKASTRNAGNDEN
ncbi:MAG: M48 family metallopeptidase [Bacteroidales bacterium]